MTVEEGDVVQLNNGKIAIVLQEFQNVPALGLLIIQKDTYPYQDTHHPDRVVDILSTDLYQTIKRGLEKGVETK